MRRRVEPDERIALRALPSSGGVTLPGQSECFSAELVMALPPFEMSWPAPATVLQAVSKTVLPNTISAMSRVMRVLPWQDEPSSRRLAPRPAGLRIGDYGICATCFSLVGVEARTHAVPWRLQSPCLMAAHIYRDEAMRSNKA